MITWKIDDTENYPLAVVEDTDDGEGICVVGSGFSTTDAILGELAVAKQIVREHNCLAALLTTLGD